MARKTAAPEPDLGLMRQLIGLPEVQDAQVTAWQAGDATQPITPRSAVLLLLHVSWLRWHAYAGMLHEQVDNGGSGDDTGAGSSTSGVIGHKQAASPVTGGIYPTGEEIRALVLAEGSERDRCARLALQAHNMGIA